MGLPVVGKTGGRQPHYYLTVIRRLMYGISKEKYRSFAGREAISFR